MQSITKKLLGMAGLLISLLFLYRICFYNSLPGNYGKVDHQLFLAGTDVRPLVVGFGGSEGGMVFAELEGKNIRDSILTLGFHFLAVGYFGTPDTPDELDRISLDAIYDTIASVARQPLIDRRQIIVLGVSRGGELVINLASRFDGFAAVIAVMPSNVSLPSRFGWCETSSWTHGREEVTYVKASGESIKLIRNGDFYGGFKALLVDQESTKESEIEIERIRSPILLVSAVHDEVWPSTMMCNRMMDRLEANNFNYSYRHIKLDGKHTDFVAANPAIFEFLSQHFPRQVLK